MYIVFRCGPYKARDGIATLAHGTWGSFWLAYLILNILVGTHVVAQPSQPEQGKVPAAAESAACATSASPGLAFPSA